MSLGFGAALHYLSGGSPKNPDTYYGRKIVEAKQDGDEFILKFDDGVGIRIYDGGQSCCEHRYMDTDDDLKDLVGHKLVGIEPRSAAPTDGESDEHEIVFLDIKTDDNMISFSFHNEHNGYYGGFGLSLDEIK